MPDQTGARPAELGRVQPPYGGQEQCSNLACRHPLDEHRGVYMYRDAQSDKLCLFCGHCAQDVDLNHPLRFRLVAL